MHFSTSSPKIQNKGIRPRHICAVFHALILLLLLLHSRSLFPEGEGPAVFVATSPQHVWVEAERSSGERQTFDVSVPGAVEKMTVWLGVNSNMDESLNILTYISGQHIRVAEDFTGNTHIEVTWMRAGMRMTLGILLHPDRMNTADWEDIAGIGPVLARRIVSWRQKNGDFGSILRLQQVAGVGPKTITSLRPWFIPHQLPVN